MNAPTIPTMMSTRMPNPPPSTIRPAKAPAMPPIMSQKMIQRWPHPFGQSSEIFKWNVRGSHAANLIAGSVAKYASSGVRSSRLE
jgi:hypothetical protein